MYGRESPLPWSTPPRRRTATAGSTANDDPEPSSTSRFSAGFTYAGMDGSGSTSSGGFTNVASGGALGGHTRSGSLGGYSSPAPGGVGSGASAERTNREKVNQIVQAYFGKAAMIILHTRVTLPPIYSPKTGTKKVNKWFNIELDETDAFREDLQLWRSGDSFEPRPPPLIIETYLDATDLTANQSLVILDGEGKRWNVNEALDTAAARAGVNTGSRRGGRAGASRHEVILERWTVDVSAPYDIAHAPELPVVYKKGIILFRALYTYAGLMPTWKFRRRLSKVKLNTSALKVNCRIINGNGYSRTPKELDLLEVPLYGGGEDVIDSFFFGKVESPAGYFNISVAFRTNCEFRVDDSEALLSSHFINLDEHYFRPSLHRLAPSQPLGYASVGKEMNSLPSTGIHQPTKPEYSQTYGSLSSFHHQGAVPSGASPLSALRSAAEMADRASLNGSPIERPPTGLRSIQGSKSSLRSFEGTGVQRRPSVSFMQPFKSPSLSASPANSEQVAPSPRTSLSRIMTPAAPSHRQRPNLGTMSPTFRGSSGLPEGMLNQNIAVTSSLSGSSPLAQAQPIMRIASSFGQRRPRIASGASRTDDDNTSSGKASYTSSAAPGSGLYLEAGANSTMDEDLQIRDFMSMLAIGQKQTLKSFQSTGTAGEGSSKRAGNALSKFQKMRDSQSALADSMSSSLLLQPSLSPPSTSSGHLPNVPGMVPSTAFSSSSSPGKPISPHTPHTPAKPSRLSLGPTAQYEQRRHRPLQPPQIDQPNNRERETSERRPASDQQMTTVSKTSPLDIPNSPRPFGPRRSNSMSQQPEDGGASLDFDPAVTYGPNRRQSASLGSVNIVPLSLSRLLDLQNASETALPGREGPDPKSNRDNDGDESLAFGLPRPPFIESVGQDDLRFQQRYTQENTSPGPGSPGQSSQGHFTVRGRGTPPTGPTSSLVGERTSSGVTHDRLERPSLIGRRTPSYTRPSVFTEDEELLFAMSDMTVAQQSRKSLEQERGGKDGSTSSSGRRKSRGGGPRTSEEIGRGVWG